MDGDAVPSIRCRTLDACSARARLQARRLVVLKKLLRFRVVRVSIAAGMGAVVALGYGTLMKVMGGT